MKLTLLAHFGVLAFSAALVPSGYACGKPDPRSALSALLPSLGIVTGQPLPVEATLGLAHDERETGSQSVVGLRLTTGTIQGQQTQSFEAFTSDALEVLNDNGSPLEGNVCLGVCQSGPRGLISVNHPFWLYDPNGNLIGTAVIRSNSLSTRAARPCTGPSR